MCTVTIYRLSDKIYFTQNRDESKNRERAIPPSWHGKLGDRWLYPIDPLSGGSWFVAHENKARVYALFNGAAHKHKHEPPYRKSRGRILLELLEFDDAQSYFHNTDFHGIEPFSVLSLEGTEVTLFRFDGQHISQENIGIETEIIYSSSTLYDPQSRIERARVYHQYSENFETWEDVISFHQLPTIDHHEGIMIDRPQVATQNIFSLALDADGTYLDHQFLITE